MALSQATLKSGIQAIMAAPFPRNSAEAADRWSAAYASYAASATSCGGVSPASLAAAQAALKGVLTGVFAARSPTPNAAASAFASAFTAFWIAPPVVFAPHPFPGVVTVVGGTAALGPALLSAWSSNLATRARADAASSSIASALHAFTLTVVVTHPIVPTPCVSPIF